MEHCSKDNAVSGKCSHSCLVLVFVLMLLAPIWVKKCVSTLLGLREQSESSFWPAAAANFYFFRFKYVCGLFMKSSLLNAPQHTHTHIHTEATVLFSSAKLDTNDGIPFHATPAMPVPKRKHPYSKNLRQTAAKMSKSKESKNNSYLWHAEV